MNPLLAAGGVAAVFALYEWTRPAPRRAAGAAKAHGPSIPETRTVTRTLTRFVDRSAPESKGATSPEAALASAGLQTVAPALPGVASRSGSLVLGSASERLGFFGGTGATATGVLSNVLGKVGELIGQANVPLAGIFGAKLAGLRGKSERQQSAIFGKATVETVATGFSAAVPFVGAAVGQGLKLLAGTGEGKRAVAAVGNAEEGVYKGQQRILSGHVSEGFTRIFGKSGIFSGGGSSHKERVAALASAQKTPETIANSPTLAKQDQAARQLATNVAAGKGAPGDTASSAAYAKVVTSSASYEQFAKEVAAGTAKTTSFALWAQEKARV